MLRRLPFVLALVSALFPVAGRAAHRPAAVVAVQPAGVADLVLLDAGFAAGFRQGMVCRVVRGTAEIAEILLVELRPGHSAALILSSAPRQAIQPGDAVQLKLLKS